MKKTLIFTLLFMILLSGCSKKDNNTNVEQKDNTQEINTSQLKRPTMPDFERPEDEPGLRGLVKNVTGNEVTVLELAALNIGDIAADHENTAQNDSAPVATFGTGAAGGGMRPGMGIGGGDRANVDEGTRLEMMKSMATGEAKVTIPVGIKMLKNEDGKMVEATLLDVTTNKMLLIWVNKDIEDRKVAEFVVIN